MYIDIVEAVKPSEEYKEPPTELCDYLSSPGEVIGIEDLAGQRLNGWLKTYFHRIVVKVISFQHDQSEIKEIVKIGTPTTIAV